MATPPLKSTDILVTLLAAYGSKSWESIEALIHALVDCYGPMDRIGPEHPAVLFYRGRMAAMETTGNQFLGSKTIGIA